MKTKISYTKNSTTAAETPEVAKLWPVIAVNPNAEQSFAYCRRKGGPWYRDFLVRRVRAQSKHHNSSLRSNDRRETANRLFVASNHAAMATDYIDIHLAIFLEGRGLMRRGMMEFANHPALHFSLPWFSIPPSACSSKTSSSCSSLSTRSFCFPPSLLSSRRPLCRHPFCPLLRH